MSEISVIVITRNEERDIGAALKSVQSISNDIVVVDSGSTDQTIPICKKFTQNVFHHDWAGYGPQKQFALDKAKGPWVINIDADERITPELSEELKNVVSAPSDSKNGYEIPFDHYFLGQKLRFGASWGEKHIRLFKKEAAQYGQDRIHEGIEVKPPVGKLRGHIEHHSYQNIDEYLKKCHEYTDLIAQKKYAQGKRFHIWHHLRLPYEFFVRYIFKLGFLDGLMGLKYAVLSSYYVWLKYVKLKKIKEN